MVYMLIIQWQCSQCGENTVYSLRLLRHLAAIPRMKRDYVSRVRTGQCQCRRCAQPGEVVKWWHFLLFRQSMQSIHGIMGSPEPNWISQVRPPPDCKYTHSTTPGLRVIGCRVAVPRSHWSAVPTPLFIYISQLLRDLFSVSQQPPSGNLLPIIPWAGCWMLAVECWNDRSCVDIIVIAPGKWFIENTFYNLFIKQATSL